MEFVETRASEQLCQWLSSWPGGKRLAVLLGRIGSGKTATIEYCASRMGYTVYRPSTPEEALAAAPRRHIYRLIIHLDRPYRMGFNNRMLRRLVSSSTVPVVAEDEPHTRRFYEPLAPAIIMVEPPRNLSKLLSGARLRHRVAVQGDVRQILLSGAYGSTPLQPSDWLSPVERWLRSGDASGLDPNHLPVILDTILPFCHGLECYEYIALIVAADVSSNPDVLGGYRLARAAGRVSMRFYERVKALKESAAEPGDVGGRPGGADR